MPCLRPVLLWSHRRHPDHNCDDLAGRHIAERKGSRPVIQWTLIQTVHGIGDLRRNQIFQYDIQCRFRAVICDGDCVMNEISCNQYVSVGSFCERHIRSGADFENIILHFAVSGRAYARVSCVSSPVSVRSSVVRRSLTKVWSGLITVPAGIAKSRVYWPVPE